MLVILQQEMNNFDFINKIALKYFDLFGICTPDIPVFFQQKYIRWLDLKYNADLQYMENNINKKFNPSLILNNVKTVFVCATKYANKDIYRNTTPISLYARSDDYHKKIKEKQKQFIIELSNVFTKNNFKPYVDSGPAWERIYAYKAGLGWIGKNNCLITKQFGSFVFLSVIYTDLNIQNNNIVIQKNLCGDCSKCIDACPNKALEEYLLNCNKCISYHTTTKQGDINIINTKGYIKGCDICQIVCPFNKP